MDFKKRKNTDKPKEKRKVLQDCRPAHVNSA